VRDLQSGHFDYNLGMTNGPENWGSLQPDFFLCGSGRRQSPININTATIVRGVDVPLQLDHLHPIQIVNTGNTLRFNMEDGSALKIDAPTRTVSYNAVQMHMHHMSEHTIDGKRYDIEIHFVYQNPVTKSLAVLAVLVTEGSPNPAFDVKFLEKIIPRGNEVQADKPLGSTVNANALFPKDRSYWYYQGSLTTPPCSEGVEWFVFRNAITMSRQQMNLLVKGLSRMRYASESGRMTYRPALPLYDRVVTLGYPDSEHYASLDSTREVSSAVQNPRKVVFVAGADGRIGQELVRSLQKRGVTVRAGVHNLNKVRGMFGGGVSVVEFDVTNEVSKLQRAIQGVDVVVSCVGFRPTYIQETDRILSHEIDNVGNCNLISAASTASVGEFILVSSLLTTAPKDNLNRKLLNALGNVAEEKRLSEVALIESGLNWTIIRPGVFSAEPQGEIILGNSNDFTGGTQDRYLGPRIRCQSPFMATSGTSCAVTRAQVAGVITDIVMSSNAYHENRGRVMEIVARPFNVKSLNDI